MYTQMTLFQMDADGTNRNHVKNSPDAEYTQTSAELEEEQ
jgi:hypothetical protein